MAASFCHSYSAASLRRAQGSLFAMSYGPRFQLSRTVTIPIQRRCAAASSKTASSRKKQIVVGSSQPKKWNELTIAGKVARTTSTGTSFLTIVTGFILTVLVGTFLYDEVLSPDSKTTWFNRAVNRIKNDPRCTVLLGEPSTVKAYGEPTWNKWAMNRPLASSTYTDRYGHEHLMMHFNVEGNIDKGTVKLHVIKRKEDSHYHYKYLYLDVKGQQRIYLESSDDKSGDRRNERKGVFGIRWSW